MQAIQHILRSTLTQGVCCHFAVLCALLHEDRLPLKPLGLAILAFLRMIWLGPMFNTAWSAVCVQHWHAPATLKAGMSCRHVCRMYLSKKGAQQSHRP